MSLYQMTTDFRRLLEAIENGEIPEEAIDDTLEAVSGSWEERADAVISAIKNLKAEADAIRTEELSLAERRKRKDKVIDRLKEYFTVSLHSIGRERYESARHLVSFRKSAPLKITDVDAFISYAMLNHPEAVRIKEILEPDKDAIKELLKTVELPYCVIEEKYNMQIK